MSTRFRSPYRPWERLTDVPFVSSDVISTTVAAVLLEFLKTNERTVFWSDEANANLDPFHNLGIGFWGADWDLKVSKHVQLERPQYVEYFHHFMLVEDSSSAR